MVWPMVSCHLCGNRPTPGLMQEALIKLSGQFNRARGRGRGLMARLEKQTKQPGRLSQSPADKLTHFILARGPSHQVSTPPALTSTSGLREGQSQLPSQPEGISGLTGFFLLPSRTAVNAQTGVCTPAGGLVTGEPHPHSFFTLGAYGGSGGGGEPIVLRPCTAFLPSLCRSITVQWITRLPHT